MSTNEDYYTRLGCICQQLFYKKSGNKFIRWTKSGYSMGYNIVILLSLPTTLMKGDCFMYSFDVYSDFSLLKNLGFDFADDDELYAMYENNLQNRAEYKDFTSTSYCVIDDSEINQLFIPATESVIDCCICGMMYKTQHYAKFINRDWIKRFNVDCFGILRLSTLATSVAPSRDLAVNVVNAPFVNYVPRGAEIECQLYAVPIKLQYFTTNYEAKHSYTFEATRENSLDSLGAYDHGVYFICADEQDCDSDVDGTAVIYARVISKELRKNKLTGLNYVYMELECDGLHIDLLVDPQQLPLPLEKINYVKGVILLYANVKQKNYEVDGICEYILLEQPMDEDEFCEKVAKIISALRDIKCEHLVIDFGEKFKHGLEYIQTARNSYIPGEKPGYEVEVSIKKDEGKWPERQMFAIRDELVGAERATEIFRQLCVEDKAPDLTSWTDITEEVFGESSDEYCSKNSIYLNISLNTEGGKLRKDYELPAYGKKKLFADGAQDGTALYHIAKPQTDCGEQLLAALKCVDQGDFAAAEKGFAAILEKYSALAIADDVCNTILNNKTELYLANVYRFAAWIIRSSKNKELVKVAFVMLEPFDVDEGLMGVVRHLGQCVEFTLFAIFLMRHWEDGNEEIFALGKQVRDWGRIHAIDYLDADTEEIKSWLIEAGLDDIFMPAYAALTVFEKADMPAVLAAEELSYAKLHGCLKIFSSLLDEGPVPGISRVADAQALLGRLLEHARKHKLQAEDLDLLYNIMLWCEEKDAAVYSALGAEIRQLLDTPEYMQLARNVAKDGEACDDIK